MSTLFPLISEGWVGLGLDMRFLGEKWQKKNKAATTTIESVVWSFGRHSSVAPHEQKHSLETERGRFRGLPGRWAEEVAEKVRFGLDRLDHIDIFCKLWRGRGGTPSKRWIFSRLGCPALIPRQSENGLGRVERQISPLRRSR
jgi:hypothetical protein